VGVTRRNGRAECPGQNVRGLLFGPWTLAWLGFSILLSCCSGLVRAQTQTLTAPGVQNAAQAARPLAPAVGAQDPNVEAPGTVAGTIVDQTGALVPGAHVELLLATQSLDEKTVADDNGQFYFLNVPPGYFQLKISAEHFADQVFSGTVHPGEHYVTQIALALATATASVTVTQTEMEVAEEQIKVEETQRVLGFIPNFYVSYIRDAAPLTSRQKFELAWKTTIDPVTFALTAATAGIEQASDQYNAFGQGAEGYGKRFGTAYADTVSATFIGSAILPSLLRQDPRYFYKGTGTAWSRFLYAVAHAVICQGDNKRSQPNYSNIFGSLAAGGISNLYYPTNGRNGAELALESSLIGIGETAATNILQEFVIRKFTPSASKANPDPP
jgi:Carboxypeptidase regulatory-like domain